MKLYNMGKYIDKSALVAEIERKIKETEEHWKTPYGIETATGRGILMGYNDILFLLNTLEEKEIHEDIDECLSGKDKTMDDTIDYWYLKYLQEKKESEGIMGVLKTGYEKGRADAFIQMQRGWSEEDESKMNNLCHFLEEYGNQYYGNLTLQLTISWLKSLKHQSHWKPSDEQMKTLELIINSHSLDAYHLGMVQHLYNGLKTLKE